MYVHYLTPKSVGCEKPFYSHVAMYTFKTVCKKTLKKNMNRCIIKRLWIPLVLTFHEAHCDVMQ